MKSRYAAPLLLLPILAALSSPALAQGTAHIAFRGWGVRAGLCRSGSRSSAAAPA